MIASGCALAIAPSSVPTSPSLASARIVSDNNLVPVLSFGATSSSIALHHCRYAGHRDDIADPEPRCPGYLVCNERGTVRDAGHAQARLVELAAGLGQPLPEDRHRLGVERKRDTEGLRQQSAAMSSWVGPMPPVVNT